MTVGGAEQEELLAAVRASIAGPDDRLNHLLDALVAHLHAFVAETRPTEREWLLGLDFLMRTGQACTERRDEVILLSDMLGLTSAVDDVNHVGPPNMTPSSVEGPFHAPAPPRELGAWIAEGPERGRGEAAVVHGRVLDCDGNPLTGAVLDIWQASDDGLYDTQDPDQDLGNLRALLHAEPDGSYWFRTIVPSSYPVPTDGPVGELLREVGRHPMRPAHVHLRVDAPGYKRLTTHLFVAGDEYLGSDAAFAVKDALVVPFEACDDPTAMSRFGMDEPFRSAAFDLRMVPEAGRAVLG